MMVDDIRTVLASNGHGTAETDLFIHRMPPTPVDATCVYAAPGEESEKGLCPEPICERPHGQVLIRRASFDAAYVEAQSISELLDSLVGFGVSNRRYLEVSAQPPVPVGRDEAEAPVFAVSFAVRRLY
jgi:hypothetical protein